MKSLEPILGTHHDLSVACLMFEPDPAIVKLLIEREDFKSRDLPEKKFATESSIDSLKRHYSKTKKRPTAAYVTF